ncbi:hypothetical protein [Salininema proteolyticum]|uniref:Uncharacterized protein n=1 Tax=Salininema proteolyticum TaxID=1607685 RepID=A0ABV8TU67_9ACTN
MVSLGRPSQFASGGYFKPAEATSAAAILVEPTSVARNVETTFNDEVQRRDEVTADVTIFDTAGDVEAGQPTRTYTGARIVQRLLAADAAGAVGQAFAARLGQKKMGPATAYRWEDLDSATEKQVAAYLEKRGEVSASSETAPSFDAPAAAPSLDDAPPF